MRMNMTARRRLLGSAAALALATGASAAHAQTFINAGGSTLASPTYSSTFAPFQSTNPNFDFSDGYFPSGSGAAQTAVATNIGNGANGCSALGTCAATPFELGASDATVNETSTGLLATWNADAAALGYGRAHDGLLVEVPTFGTPITMASDFAGATSNGAITLTDTQICGIFSGRINTLQDNALAGSGITGTGTLNVVYRGDNSGTSFLFTQHLAAVCVGPGQSGQNSNVTFFATQTFANSFSATGGVPSNFISGNGSPGVQDTVAATVGRIGYLSPDYTAVAATPARKPLKGVLPVVASVRNAINGTTYLPTSSNTSAALATGTPAITAAFNASGTTFNPTDPNSFIPVAANPSAGYPIVGFTTFLLPQCYADPNVAAGVKNYINSLYTATILRNIVTSNGFALLPTATRLAVSNTYLVAGSANAINSAGTGACASVAGR